MSENFENKKKVLANDVNFKYGKNKLTLVNG